MHDLTTVLSQTALFRHVSPAVLEEQIIPHGYLQSYAKNQFLIEPQQKLDHLGILISGTVHILHIFTNGTCRLMQTVTAKEVLGADLVCTKSRVSPYHAAAACAAQVFYVPASILLTPGIPDEAARLSILNQLLLLISQENMKKEYRLAILSQNGLRDRILTYLTMQANRQKQSTFAVPFNREELASFLCVNRSALSHELSLLQQEGIISFQKNRFTLHQLPPISLPL